MSVTPPVSHVEMWPYVASADALFESHAATAVRMVVSSAISGATVGAGVAVGSDVGASVGAGVGASVSVEQSSICTTPHDVDSHGVLVNAS